MSNYSETIMDISTDCFLKIFRGFHKSYVGGDLLDSCDRLQ